MLGVQVRSPNCRQAGMVIIKDLRSDRAYFYYPNKKKYAICLDEIFVFLFKSPNQKVKVK